MIAYSVITSRGERERNEDYTGVAELGDRTVFLLADGLGGHSGGADASRFVVEEMKRLLNEHNDLSIEQCIQESQDGLLREQKRVREEDAMRTTITVLDIRDGYAQFFHVGDSRIYYFHRNKYTFRSGDHSVPQMLYMSGRIREKDIRHHPDRSKLIRVMGMEWNAPKYDVSKRLHIAGGDAFLLCSDGFWELIEEKQMTKMLKRSSTPEEWLSAMEQEILKNGTGTNMDNYSAVAVRVI